MTIDTKDLYDLAVIGGGPAGLTAAIYMGRARYKTLVLEKAKVGGQITITEEVVNYPGVFRSSGSELVATMANQAKAFGATIEVGDVVELDLSGDIKTITCADGKVYRALTVLFATGAHPRHIGFKGEDEFAGRGVAYCATCDGEFFSGLDIFVVGGGFAAAEEGMFLTRYGKSVTFIVREPDFTCAKSIADEVKEHEDINIHYNSEVVEVGGDEFLTYAVFRNNETGETWRYDAPEGKSFGIFVFAGYVPNTKLCQGWVNLDEQGYIITGPDHSTNRSGVFAAGDVCVKNLRQVVTAVSDGAIAATSAEKEAARIHQALDLPPFEIEASRVDHGEMASPKEAPKSASDAQGAFLPAEMRGQVGQVFEKFASPVTLVAYVDNSPLGENLRGFAKEIEGIHEKVAVEIRESEEPRLAVEKEGKDAGISFYGVPGGHEFNSFVLALYNVAGPGQEIPDSLLKRAEETGKRELNIVVSLSCTMCPDLVQAAMRLGARLENWTVSMRDMQYFPELREKYNIMSVPCMIVDDDVVTFGKKDAEELVSFLEKHPKA